ncbi:MAG: hypothetical protein JW863_14125 [Chitinispirillaceae bacterium]|nr:hypothetical protein [Chitinispirillaceae bacterium]
MRAYKLVCICLVAIVVAAPAKNTYTSFSLGMAVPMTSAALTPTGDKTLGMGWDGGLTFFGLPFTLSDKFLSGLAFGGKINYNRWVRDSTMKELYFLGTQGILRYYTPLNIKPFDLFVQAGCGMFIGEHGFADPDTVPAYPLPTEMEVIEGKKNLGVSFNIGVNMDILELAPGITMVFTSGKPSMWFSLNAAAKF